MSKAIELIEKYKVEEITIIPKDALRLSSDVKNSNVGNDLITDYIKNIGMKITSVSGPGIITYKSKNEVVGWFNEKTKELFLDKQVFGKWVRWANAGLR